MSKKVEMNGSYFMSIELKIKNPRPMVRLFYPSSHLPVLFSEVLLSLFVAWVTILRCFRRLPLIVSMSKKIYENFVGIFETVRNRELSVLERCLHCEFLLYKIRWISGIVCSGFKSCSGCLPVLPSANVSS